MMNDNICHWCQNHNEKTDLDFSVIDDDIGQPVPEFMIRFCPFCGRNIHSPGERAIYPPCNIGDCLYFVGVFTGQIVTALVIGIQVTEHDMFLFADNGCFVSVKQQLGKTIFLNKEDAEKAAKGDLKNESEN